MLTGPQNSPAEKGDFAPVSKVSTKPPSIRAANLGLVRDRARLAAVQCGRDPQDIALIAVSKQQPATDIREVAELGQRDFGESYLQEALPKIEALRELGLTWHYIGHIQTNKTRLIANAFAWVHTVDRLKVAERLNEQREPALGPLNVCLQIKLADEPGKAGAAPQDVPTLAERVKLLPNLHLRGLMCIPPPVSKYDEQLALFKRCAGVLADLNNAGLRLDTLSMGMSDDLEAAIAAGATFIRIGTAIFGSREK